MVGAGLVFLDYPVVGVGPGMYKHYSRDYGSRLGLSRVDEEREAHNLILGLAAETGTVGLVAFLMLFGSAVFGTLRILRTEARRRPELAALATGFFASLWIYFMSGLFLHMAYARFFFVVLALAAFVAAAWIPGAPLHGLDGVFPRWVRVIVPLLFFAFLLPGLVYGIATGALRSDRDAARIMGAGRMYTLRKVVLPLVASGMVVTFLFVFILNWAEFLLALTLTHPDVSTLPVLLNKFQSASEGRLYGPQAAIGTVITIPVVIMGMLIQKHLVKGFSFGMMRR